MKNFNTFTFFNQLTAMPKRLAMVLTVLFTLGVGSMLGADTWTLVKDVNDLAVGDEIVIAAHAADCALSTSQKSNNRGQAAITKTGDNITINNSVQILIIQAGTTSGKFAFYTGSGYLYAASSSSNYLRTQTTNNANGSWTISITSTGVATIKATGSNTKNWLRYNSSSSIFSCYSSGQADVAIYKKVSADPYTVTFHAGSGTCDDESLIETSGGAGVTLPTANPPAACATDGWKFAGWWTEAVTETTTSPGKLLTADSNYKPTSNCTLYAVYSYTEAGGGDSNVTFKFSDIATANSWTNGTAYTTVTISPITINANGGGNNGKYYTSNTSWRMYNGGSLQISTDIGKITSVSSNPSKTFTINDEGIATLSFSATTEFKSITVSYSSTTTTYNSNPSCEVCENILSINKGAETNGTFILSQIGDIETCDGVVEVVVTPTPAEHHSVRDVTATTPTSGGAPTVTDKGDGTWTVTYTQNSTGESIINVTFEEDTKASITLSELGVENTDNTTYYVGETYTLPSTSSQSCDGKQLVGWSSVEVAETDTKPTENYYELGAEVTLAATQTFYAVFATAEETTGGTVEATLSFADTAQRTSWSTSQQVWEQNGVTFTHDKVSGDNIVNNYGPIRCYKNSKITITHTSNEITKIVFDCNSNEYATALENSIGTIDGVAVSKSSDKVTVSFTNAVTSFAVTLSSGQVRLDGITVTAGGGTITTYSDYSTTCVKLPDPVLSFATEPANPIVFTDAVCGGNSSKQSVTVVGENLRDVVNVSVTGPYKIARTASTALKDFTTSLTLDKTAAGAIHSNYQTVYIISTPPAQSIEATTGTLTFTTKKGNTLTVNLSTPTVNCTTYALTFNDRGNKTVENYYAGVEVPQPADPTGVCTEPIHYVFDGWAEATVTNGSTEYTKVTFPYTMPGQNKTLYAVYRYVEEGSGDSGDYVKVTDDLDDYSGDYLIVYDAGNVAFDGGRNNVDDELDATSNTIEVTINDNTIASNATTDAAKFTIAKVDGGYSIKSASGYYIGWSTADKNGLNANSKYSANYYLNTISNSIISGVKGTLKFNKTSGQERFRYYQSGQESIALYRKAASYLYTTSPVCGPHVEITSDKDIYITSGFANGRNTVIAQKKITFAATRLKPSAGGAAPSIKVPAADITLNGSKTDKVKIVDITQNIVLQDDGITYAGTGEITVSYTPTASNIYEDINVQLRAEHNTGSDVSLDAFTVHARSLPAEFVIVAKSGDKWYALNGDMNINAANPANGQVTVDNDANPTKATYAPCNTIYTFDGVPNTGDRTYVRFQGTDGAWLWASSGTNVGIQNNVLKTTPEGSNKAYNWKLYTEDNITYRFGNANSSRQLTLNSEKFGMYASGVQDIRILPYETKCLYNYAPTNLKVSVLKGSYVTLTWDAVAGATKYQYSTNGTTWTDAGTEPTVTISGLSNGTDYIYYVRAYHADAGVSQECFDYSEVSFTTADCDDVPTDITYTADLNSITVSWTASAQTATIKLYSDEAGSTTIQTLTDETSPCKFADLTKNTTYYVQVFADGTCASQIVKVSTEDVEVDIVEWMEDGIIVDINTNETVGVTLENEVSYGSGTGAEATELFFSKYYEATGNVKLVALYNGTKNIIDLTNYEIHYGNDSWENTYITLKDFGSTKGQIQPGEELILYTTGDTENDTKIMNCVHNQYPDGKWVEVTSSNNTGKGTLSFAGKKTLVLKKAGTIIDVIGALDSSGKPTTANAKTTPSWGDDPGWTCAAGLSIADDTEIGISTNRCLLVRNNDVTSGANAVERNIDDFVTLCSEWKGAQVPNNNVDKGVAASCENFAYVGTFDYSDYYTKYESMGDEQEFDENARNADGTVTIPITDLYKQSCRNIRIKLSNSNGDVLTDREYKVPIMITTDQATAYTEANKADNAFYALQDNLATIEVDENGDEKARYPLTIEQVREICKTCDVVIRDKATLTKAADDDANDHPQVNNVFIYEGASLVIPDGTNETITSLSLRRKGDIVASAKVEEGGKLHLPASATAPIYLDMRIDANNWHWFTLPYNCNIADVTWVDGTPAQYNKDWFVMYYDGESRAASTNPYDNHWKVYNGTTIEAGKGYIVGIKGNLSKPDYTFELRFPMAAEVLTHEHTDKNVAVNAWGVKSDNTPNNLGWNLVGNPYLDYYKTSENISFTGLSLLKYTGIDPVTGDRLYDDSGNSPFLVTPIDGGWYEYKQELASDVDMQPFTAYFVQVGDPANEGHSDGMELNASFETDKRGRSPLIRRAPSEVDDLEEPAIVAVSLTNAKGESDKTSLIIDDQYTDEYEMNADFFKWFGDYYKYYTKPVLYTIGADQGKRAFNALSEELATQPVSLGMYAAQAGNYTFSLDLRSDLSKVQEVWLYDATQDTYTNLLQDSYTFQTAKTESAGRFFLSVKMAPKVSTNIDNIADGTIWATTQDHTIFVNGLLSNAQLWIYDATGKLLHTDQTQYFQHSYSVPISGTYFVRVQNTMQTQTIKVVVE